MVRNLEQDATPPSPRGHGRICPFPCAWLYGAITAHKVLSGHWLKGARKEQSLIAVACPGLILHDIKSLGQCT